MQVSSVFLAIAILSVCRIGPAGGQWPSDGVAICTAASTQWNAAVVSDGAGGAIITWADSRSTTNYDIYAQRVNAAGVLQWEPDGVALCVAANNQERPTIVSDGAAGAIIAWHDYRNGLQNSDIYAQRVNGAGVPQWADDGVALCTAADYQADPMIGSDESGGAFVTWQDLRTGVGTDDIYMQRVNAVGGPQWAPDGIPLSTAAGAQQAPKIISNDGEAIVVWHDSRLGVANTDTYVQRVDESGVIQWTPDGAIVAFGQNQQWGASIVTDGSNGCIAVWRDTRIDTDGDLYGQRINSAGAHQWPATGIALSTNSYQEVAPTIISDGVGGAIVTWTIFGYFMGEPFADIFAQRLSASGEVQWVAGGVQLCGENGVQIGSTIVGDGAGGAIVAWEDARNGPSDVYAQRVDASGAVQWVANGVALCTAANNQQLPKIVSDGSGGAIVIWEDYRSGTADIYAIRVGPGGEIPTGVGGTTPLPSLFVGENHPNPFSEMTSMEISLPARSDVRIEVVDVVGRTVGEKTLGEIEAGPHVVTFDGRNDDGRPLPSGVYFYRVIANGVTAARKMVIVR